MILYKAEYRNWSIASQTWAQVTILTTGLRGSMLGKDDKLTAELLVQRGWECDSDTSRRIRNSVTKGRISNTTGSCRATKVGAGSVYSLVAVVEASARIRTKKGPFDCRPNRVIEPFHPPCHSHLVLPIMIEPPCKEETRCLLQVLNAVGTFWHGRLQEIASTAITGSRANLVLVWSCAL